VIDVLLSRELITNHVHSSLGILLMSVLTGAFWLSAPARVPMVDREQLAPTGAVEA